MAKNNGNGASKKSPLKPRVPNAAPNGNGRHPAGVAVTLRPARNGGQLRSGGTNKGGTGRPPEVLRMRCRSVFERWLVWAVRKVADPKTPDDVMIQIGNTTAKYGFPPLDMISRPLVQATLLRQIAALTAALPTTEAERIMGILEPIWTDAA